MFGKKSKSREVSEEEAKKFFDEGFGKPLRMARALGLRTGVQEPIVPLAETSQDASTEQPKKELSPSAVKFYEIFQRVDLEALTAEDNTNLLLDLRKRDGYTFFEIGGSLYVPYFHLYQLVTGKTTEELTSAVSQEIYALLISSPAIENEDISHVLNQCLASMTVFILSEFFDTLNKEQIQTYSDMTNQLLDTIVQGISVLIKNKGKPSTTPESKEFKTVFQREYTPPGMNDTEESSLDRFFLRNIDADDPDGVALLMLCHKVIEAEKDGYVEPHRVREALMKHNVFASLIDTEFGQAMFYSTFTLVQTFERDETVAAFAIDGYTLLLNWLSNQEKRGDYASFTLLMFQLVDALVQKPLPIVGGHYANLKAKFAEDVLPWLREEGYEEQPIQSGSIEYSGYDYETVTKFLQEFSQNESDTFEQFCDGIERFHANHRNHDEHEELQKWVADFKEVNALVCQKVVQEYNELEMFGQQTAYWLIMDNYVYHLIALGLSKELLDSVGALAFAFHRHILYSKTAPTAETALIRYLLHKGCSVNAPESEKQRTAVHYMSSNVMFMDELHSAIPYEAEPWDLTAKDKRGDMPLHLVCGNSQYTKSVDSLLGEMVSHGADPYAKSNDGMTPMGILQKAHPSMVAFAEDTIKQNTR